MLTGVFILAVIAGVVLFYFTFQHRRKNSADSANSDTHFHAVSVKPGLIACHKASTLNGTRYLSNEAPPLPLPGCGESSCSCRFIHHSDRRAGDDRRLPFQTTGGLTGSLSTTERRQEATRRATDGSDELQLG